VSRTPPIFSLLLLLVRPPTMSDFSSPPPSSSTAVRGKVRIQTCFSVVRGRRLCKYCISDFGMGTGNTTLLEHMWKQHETNAVRLGLRESWTRTTKRKADADLRGAHQPSSSTSSSSSSASSFSFVSSSSAPHPDPLSLSSRMHVSVDDDHLVHDSPSPSLPVKLQSNDHSVDKASYIASYATAS
jgi:hypothetical protein